MSPTSKRRATQQSRKPSTRGSLPRSASARQKRRPRNACRGGKKQADDFAAQRKNAAQTAKRQEEAKIRAEEKNATEAAKAKLDDAQAKRDEAARKRAQADRVEELADTEKQKRQSE